MRKGIGYYIVIIPLLVVMIYSLYQIILLVDKYNHGTQEYRKVAEEVKEGPDIDWEKLKKKNKDIIGWIWAKGTKIDYPIVQGDTNDEYLHTLITGEYDFKGSIFIDADIKKPFEDFPTIIYGHAMRDGTMFKPLFKWKEQKFYDKHKKMMILTPNQNYDFEIIACCYTTATSDFYMINLVDHDERGEYIERAVESSLIKCNVETSPFDRIVTLSTCAEASGENRVVVVGKLTEREE